MTTQTAAPSVPTPKRSRRRWYLVGGFVLFALAMPFVYLLVSSAWREHELEQIYREMDAEDPNWRWADLIKQMPAAPPDERNAMVQVEKVIGILKITPFAGGTFGGTTPKNIRMKDVEAQRLRAALAALAPTTLPEAYKLKDMPEGRVLIDPSTSPMKVEFHAMEMMNVARVLRHAALMQAHDGKVDQASDACLAIARSAHAIGDFPSLFGQMVRMGAQMEAVNSLERTLAQGVVDADRLEALQHAFAIEANHNGDLQALRGERAFGHAFYLSLHNGDKSSQQIMDEIGLRHGIKGRLYAMFPGLLIRDYPKRLRLANDMVRTSQKLEGTAFIDALHELQEKAALDPRNPLTFGFTFVPKQLYSMRADRVRVRSAVVALAAERFRLRHDDWPMNAADLVKEGLLKEWPKDLYDGQPLRFLRIDTGLIVYSVGEDKVDNRGKKGDIAFELWLPNLRAMSPAADIEAPKVKR